MVGKRDYFEIMCNWDLQHLVISLKDFVCDPGQKVTITILLP